MRRTILTIATLLAVAGAGIAIAIHDGSRRTDIRGSSSVDYVTTAAPKPARRPAEIIWRDFGNDVARLHVGPASGVRPPFRVAWVAGGTALLEFPPVIAWGRLFLANGAGHVLAIDTRTGSVAWNFDAQHGSAASPALGEYKHGTVYAAFLSGFTPANLGKSRTELAHDGEVVALSAGQGAVRWRRHIGASETSPLLVGGLLYVGDWLGKVYALDAATGRIAWTFGTGGAVKGGASYADGRVFVGSYDGHVYALDASTGRLIWRTPAAYGTFYSTPAVAYGRVYIGSTDGSVYSFAAKSGSLRWATRTGGYVYGSPAVSGNRVYVGSYDRNLYAFDAATGAVAWRFPANGAISGSATVVNGIVYFATLASRTYGVDESTGQQVWSVPGGKYTPVVADRARLYRLGSASVFGLLPR